MQKQIANMTIILKKHEKFLPGCEFTSLTIPLFEIFIQISPEALPHNIATIMYIRIMHLTTVYITLKNTHILSITSDA